MNQSRRICDAVVNKGILIILKLIVIVKTMRRLSIVTATQASSITACPQLVQQGLPQQLMKPARNNRTHASVHARGEIKEQGLKNASGRKPNPPCPIHVQPRRRAMQQFTSTDLTISWATSSQSCFSHP